MSIKENGNIEKNYTPDRVISVAVLFIYAFLTAFGLYSLTNPKWLIETSYANKKEEVSLLVYEGIELSRKNNDKDALKVFDKALSMIPDFSEAVINKGVSYKRLKMFDLALKQFDLALKLSPFDSSNVYSNMKDIYLELNDSSKAETYFQKAFETSHSTIDKYMKKGIHYYNIKNLDSSIASYKQALYNRQKMITFYLDILGKQIRKNFSESNAQSLASKNLITHFRTLDKNENDVIQPYDSVCFKLNLNTDRGLAENYNKIGFILALQGDYKEALEYFYKAVGIWEDYKDANMNIRYIYEKTGRI